MIIPQLIGVIASAFSGGGGGGAYVPPTFLALNLTPTGYTPPTTFVALNLVN